MRDAEFVRESERWWSSLPVGFYCTYSPPSQLGTKLLSRKKQQQHIRLFLMQQKHKADWMRSHSQTQTHKKHWKACLLGCVITW